MHAEEILRISELSAIVIRERGAQGRNRTTDTVIFSHVLYQLSYLGAVPDGRRLMAEKLQRVQPAPTRLAPRCSRYSSASPGGDSSDLSFVGTR